MRHVSRRRKKLISGCVCLSLSGAALTGALVALVPQSATAQTRLPWMNTNLAPATRAQSLVAAETLDQKIEQLHGQPGPIPEVPACGNNAGRHVPGISALDIPTFRITNGPDGIGQGDCSPTDPATAIPSSLALAASFDPSLASQYGTLMANEANSLGLQVIEGPGMDTARVGEGGRNFEYLGEDPLLAGTIAASEIKAIQSKGVIAMAKHFVLNDQETNRMTVQVQVDDRTLHEIYLSPFEAAVKQGGVDAVMCSYNSIGSTHACDDSQTLTTILRGQWGFKGYVQSDFGATHSTATALNAGEDLEMSTGVFFTTADIEAALADGTLTMATIDQALTRRYTEMFKEGDFDRPITHNPVDATTDDAIATQIGEQTSVLLKNDNSLLPLNAHKIKTIALIGQQSFAGQAVTGGGGSSLVTPTSTVTPLQGLQNVLNEEHSSATINQVIVNNDNSNLPDAVTAAQHADVTIIMGGAITSEGSDRADLSLPNNQDALISAVSAANPNTVVVLKDGDPVLMPWVNQVPALMEAWFPGQEDGNIVANLLFGLASPSAKLPVSYPVSAADTPTDTPAQWPGVEIDGVPTVTYSEGLQEGYRWYTTQHIKPMFPFGFGLTYTTFAFHDLKVSPGKTSNGKVLVTADVTNTGSRSGAEVAQLYVTYPSSAGEPALQLRGFQKVNLNPGQTARITFNLIPRAFSTWNSDQQNWNVVSGQFTVHVGDSSENLPLSASLSVNPRGKINNFLPQLGGNGQVSLVRTGHSQ